MLQITLPDGSQRQFLSHVTVAEVAASIGAGLAKAALAGKIGVGDDAKLVDTSAEPSSPISTSSAPASNAASSKASSLTPGAKLSCPLRSNI